MKTFVRFFALATILFLFPGILMAQHYVPTESLDKNAILEEFTGVSCPNCPSGHQVMAQILADNPDRAFCVAYHPWNSSFTTPYTGDPDFRRHYADAFYTTPYCGTSRYMPSSFVHRRLWAPPERLTSRADWPAYANTIMAEPSPMNVGMATSYDEGTSILTVIVDIYYTDDFLGEHNLMVTLAENGLISQQSGASGPYTHKHTFREAFVEQWGDPIVADASAGTFYRRTFTYDYTATDYIMENCELLAFVLDNTTEEIITGVGCHAGDTTFITPDVTLSADSLIYENPQQCLEGQIITIYNNSGIDQELLFVQQEATGSSLFPWSVDPWPFTGFPHTMAPGESIDLNVVLPLPVKGKSEFFYDELIIESEMETKSVVIGVNQGLYTGLEDPSGTRKSTLSGNYPNPFSGTTTINYTLAQPSNVIMEVFSINGNKMKTLRAESLPAGTYTIQWDGTNDAGQPLPGGIYLYRLKTNDATLTRRCVLLK